MARSAAVGRDEHAASDGDEPRVDGNVTPSKGDYYVHKSVDLKAAVTTNGVSRHQLTLTYTMPLPVDNTDRVLNKENGGVYADSLRVYLPETTANVGVNYSEDGGDGFGGLNTVSTAGGKRILAAFIRLPRGHTGVLRIDYGVALDGGRAFDLYVQKQAGVPNRHMDLTVSYPGGVAKRVSEGTMDTEFMLKW